MSEGKRDHVHPYTRHVFVCHWGKVCPTKGSQDIVPLLRQMLAARGLEDAVPVTKSGCLDLCDVGPNIVVYPEGVWYSAVKRKDLEEIVESHLVHGKPVARLMKHHMGK